MFVSGGAVSTVHTCVAAGPDVSGAIGRLNREGVPSVGKRAVRRRADAGGERTGVELATEGHSALVGGERERDRGGASEQRRLGLNRRDLGAGVDVPRVPDGRARSALVRRLDLEGVHSVCEVRGTVGDVEGALRGSSSWHSDVDSPTSLEKANEAERLAKWLDGVASSRVSGVAVPIAHVCRTVGLTFPASSVARSENACAPSPSVEYDRGLVHGAKAAASSLHSEDTPHSLAENAKLGVWSLLGSGGSRVEHGNGRRAVDVQRRSRTAANEGPSSEQLVSHVPEALGGR